MAIKEKDLLKLVRDTADELLSSPEAWRDFLDSYANFYKYSFMNGLAIYAQRPGATQCASYVLWQNIGNPVRRGVKGIRMLEKDKFTERLAYVYDVEDTVKVIELPSSFLSFTDETEKKTIDFLSANFNLKSGLDIVETVQKATESVFYDSFRESMDNYMNQNPEAFTDDFMSRIDKAAAFFSKSCQYVVLARMKLPRNSITFNMPRSVESDSLAFLSTFGTSLHNSCRKVIALVDENVVNLNRRKEHIKLDEKGGNTSEETRDSRNGNGREIRDIRPQGDRKIRQNAGGFSSGTVSPAVQHDDNQSGVDSASGIDRQTSSRADSDLGKEIETGVRFNGRTEESGYASLGAEDESDTKYLSRGNNASDSIGSTSLNESMVQMEIEEAEGKTSAFSFAQENSYEPDEQKKASSIFFSIPFSEHPAFYDKELKDRFANMSFALGNRLLGSLDGKQHIERNNTDDIGYYKTDFEITAVINGEEIYYKGRFDIGDGEGDLIAHIKNYYDYYLSPNCPLSVEWKEEGEEFYQEQMKELRLGRDVFVPFLQQHSELNAGEEKLLAEIMSTENDWNRKAERPSAEYETELPEERFEVTMTSDAFPDPEDAFAIWDNIREEDYAAEDGTVLTYPTEEEAENGLSEVRKAVADNESEEQLYVEQAKQGVMPVSAERKADTVVIGNYLSDDEAIAIMQYPNGKFYNHYGYDSRSGFSASTAGGFDTFEEAEKALYAHRPKAEKVVELTPAQDNTDLIGKEFPPEETTEDSVPAIPYGSAVLAERHNFRITDDALGVGSAKEKFKANTAAIRLLHALQIENRLATPEEQETLSRYVGWGGLADCFDEKNSHYAELKSLLSEQEYEEARESVTSAFFTSPQIIKAMYDKLSEMGFKGGKVLEPSCGVGNFIGSMPHEMFSNSQITGIEIDGISGRIASQLYPDADIKISGFEDVTQGKNSYDLVIGNVPFGDYKVNDKDYNKYNFLIHDYFFVKALDMARPGGIIALITSSGTLDKKDGHMREILAERADLIGAIRLPDTAFKKNAGTEATSDVIFLQKIAETRNLSLDNMPSWTKTTVTESGIWYNKYFSDNPQSVVGELQEVSGQFGRQLKCKLSPDVSFTDALRASLEYIKGEYLPAEISYTPSAREDENVEDVADIQKFSFGIQNGNIVFNDYDGIETVTVNDTAKKRIIGMMKIRDAARALIKAESEGYDDAHISTLRVSLNDTYDDFTKRYGHISDRANNVFSRDSAYPLLCALEITDDEGRFQEKSAIFSRRTIRPKTIITSVDNAQDALLLSMNEKGCVDLEYMQSVSSMSVENLISELKGQIFELPAKKGVYVTADEYLSGNVRQKLREARRFEMTDNITALESVIPTDLGAEEIDVRLGSKWVPVQYYQQFIGELLQPSMWAEKMITVSYSPAADRWLIANKSYNSNLAVTSTYGTAYANAYRLIEDALNLRTPQIFDEVEDVDGKMRRVLNTRQTAIASQKQDDIKAAFKKWIFAEPGRREELCRIYNEEFNSYVPRNYNGSHLSFDGMNDEICLLPHQKDAVARQLYGGNTLLYQCVGAGKTYEMIAAIMEKRRLGFCNKAMIVVPNHLVGQWASSFMALYPSAKVLAVTEKDFTAANRKKFCARIATSDVDAVVIAHSQFEMIPVSKERETAFIREQLEQVKKEIQALRSEESGGFSVKRLVGMEKRLRQKLKTMLEASPKDNVINFEELGIDFLCVDEAHAYKNLALQTKMRNISGITSSGSNRAADMFIKCRYIDEITGGTGITFATGTAISNSIAEMYTMQRFLQYDTLKQLGMTTFDSWASNFGETITGFEIAPEGTGIRQRTRFAKFFNLPELMSIFKEVADIKTQEMLSLKIPAAERIDVILKPSLLQKAFIKTIGDRADAIRQGAVDPRKDNMLLVTTDGRKVAVDERLSSFTLDSELFESNAENEIVKSKVDACVENCLKNYKDGSNKRLTQLIFCDLGTPKSSGEFSVYQDIKNKLIKSGVPENEIAFAHDAKTTAQKSLLQAKVRSGNIRVLIGSTAKMGEGMNVQNKLVAVHYIDVPWRPSDIEQREGRILRQGNNNEKVFIYRYITENTFDAYSWQTIENKQRFISPILSGKSQARSCEDIDPLILSAAQAKACASADPRIKEKIELDVEVNRLHILRSAYMAEQFKLESKLYKELPTQLASLSKKVIALKDDKAFLEENPLPIGESFKMKVDDKIYDNRVNAGEALIDGMKSFKNSSDVKKLGEYGGFDISIKSNFFSQEYTLLIARTYCTNIDIEAPLSAAGVITRIQNAIAKLPEKISLFNDKIGEVSKEMEDAKKQIGVPFELEAELKEKEHRLEELNKIFESKPEEGLDITDDVKLENKVSSLGL